VFTNIQDAKFPLLLIASMLLIIRSEINFWSAIACSFIHLSKTYGTNTSALLGTRNRKQATSLVLTP
jgi:hypothetical protein